MPLNFTNTWLNILIKMWISSTVYCVLFIYITWLRRLIGTSVPVSQMKMLPSYVLATSRVEEIHSKSHTNFVSSSKHWLLLYISSKSEFHINILWSSPLYRKKCQNVIYIWDSMNALVNILRPDFLRQTNFCSNDSR